MAAVEGKGKEKVDEPSHPAKRQKLKPLLKKRQMTSVPEVLARRETDIKQHLSLHGIEGSLGQAVAVDALGRVAHSLNILGGELWDRLKDNSALNLLELGIHTAVMVHIYLVSLYAAIPFPYFHVFTQFVSSFSLSEHSQSPPPSRCDGSKRKNS